MRQPIAALLALAGLLAAAPPVAAQPDARVPVRMVVPAMLDIPGYPAAAASAGITGVVRVQLGIGPAGVVRSATATPDVPYLSEAALVAASRSRFGCAGCDDAPTAYMLTYDFRAARAADEQATVAIVPGESILTIPSLTMTPAASPPIDRVDARPAPSLVPVWLTRPSYPSIARVARVQGMVDVRVTVRADGTVASASASPSSPFLEAAALQAARESSFICRDCDPSSTVAHSLVYEFRFADGGPWRSAPGVVITPTQSRLTIELPVEVMSYRAVAPNARPRTPRVSPIRLAPVQSSAARAAAPRRSGRPSGTSFR